MGQVKGPPVKFTLRKKNKVITQKINRSSSKFPVRSNTTIPPCMFQCTTIEPMDKYHKLTNGLPV
jgi:hypothetical protein